MQTKTTLINNDPRPIDIPLKEGQIWLHADKCLYQIIKNTGSGSGNVTFGLVCIVHPNLSPYYQGLLYDGSFHSNIKDVFAGTRHLFQFVSSLSVTIN